MITPSALLDAAGSTLSEAQQDAVRNALTGARSDDGALSRIRKLSRSSDFTHSQVKRLELLYSLAIISDNNPTVLDSLAADSDLQTLRDVALLYDEAKLAAVYGASVDSPSDKPVSKLGTLNMPPVFKQQTPSAEPPSVSQFRRKLFWREPSAVIQRMVQSKELPIADGKIRDGCLQFFQNQPHFNIRDTSVVTALQDSKALAGVPDAHVPDVTKHLKILQLTQTLTHDPKAIPTLLKKGMTSSLKVASIPEKTFLRHMGDELDVDTARVIHSHAVAVNMRNNRVLTNAYQTVKGTGIAAIDGREKRNVRAKRLADSTSQVLPQVDLETLFGSLDYCACSDCTSVFSPSAYYVELLQFIRNNDLDPDPGPTGTSYPTGTAGTSGTLLDRLFARRPDLGNLELSCANTNTLIPYIDLSNEVMESYVVYLATQNPTGPSITVFNVIDHESSNELLAAPQNTNYEAYCILNSAVYPPQSLPYCQPIDSMRINLKSLGTSRYQLMTVFQKPYTPPITAADGSAISSANQKQLATIHQTVLTRAADAEFLSIIQGEYIILTKQAFWPIEYFDIMQNQQYTVTEYQTDIGLKSPNEYWGLSLADMESQVEADKVGLMFVEAQLLRRSGLTYMDLVSVLKTRFINPNYPQGKALVILDSIQFSYRFLQRLVDTTAKQKSKRFAKLIEFLIMAEIALPKPAASDCDCSGETHSSMCQEISQLCCWVHRWFDRIGCLIVLESGEGRRRPWRGDSYAGPQPAQQPPDPPKIAHTALAKLLPSSALPVASTKSHPPVPRKRFISQPRSGSSDSAPTMLTNSASPAAEQANKTSNPILDVEPQVPIAILNRDGSILDYKSKETIAYVQLSGKVLDTSGNPWVNAYSSQNLDLAVRPIKDIDGSGEILSNGYLFIDGDPAARSEGPVRVTWTSQQDDCNLDNVRLRHLDGSEVIPNEYYRLHVFLRLWRKMGWTIDETDKAIVGLTPTPEPAPSPSKPTPTSSSGDEVTLGDFSEACTTGKCGKSSCPRCKKSPPASDDKCSCCDDDSHDPVEFQISPDLLHQFVAFVQLLPLSSLEVVQQLAWFTDIDTVGSNSLYAQLFLTVDAIGIDPIFGADSNGNYLTTSTTISAHQGILLSAFQLNAAGLAAIITYAAIPDSLTLANVSLIYRYALLSSVLQVQPSSLPDYIALFGNPFASASAAVSFLNTSNSMTAAGFTITQVLYIVRGVNNPLKPLGPTTLQILQTSKTIFDGLNSIMQSNPPITTENNATDTAVQTNTALLMEPALVQQIVAFLDGTTVYKTNAPSGLTLTIPADLSQKLVYTNAELNSTVATTGILTPAQVTEAKSLTADIAWSSAIDRLNKQALQFFNQNLAGIFSNTTDAIANLVTPGDNGTNSATKRLYFMTYLIPYIQGQLSDQLIVTTLAGAVGLNSTTTEALLSEVLVSGNPPETALTAFRAISTNPVDNPTDWTGYLIPPTTDSYTFSLQSDTQPQIMTMNGHSIQFPNQQDDPNNVWLSNSVKLIGGRSYLVEIRGPSAAQIQWKTTRSTFAQIPSSALLPDYSTSLTTTLFTAFFKAAMIINGFNLSVDEVLFFQTHSSDFSDFDLNSPLLPMWLRLIAYTTLRSSLSSPNTTLLKLFIWADDPNRTGSLTDTVSAVTLWPSEYINALIGPFSLNVASFKNEVALIQMQTAVTIAQKTSIAIPTLFSWAKPLAKFWEAHEIAVTISTTIRGKYSLSDWEQVVKPLNDQLRADQQTALSNYLLVQPTIQKSGVADLNSLFDYFLIDVQMCPCFQTARLKQATSSVQLFIQRCFFGLEGDDPSIQNLDRDRWAWMSKYRVWQANREVFLYPENYMVSSLRDDKTPFYQQLESELLQKDVGLDTMLDSVKNYLYSVDQVANLQVVGLFIEDQQKNGAIQATQPLNVHIFGRTPHSPYLYFYRYYSVQNGTWTPWSPIKIDISNNDIEIQGQVKASGTYVIPFIYAGRLMIAIPQFSIKTIPQPVYPSTSPMDQGKDAPNQASQCYEIKLGFSELQNGTWSQKQISSTAVYTAPVPPIPTSNSPAATAKAGTAPLSLDPASIAQFQFVPVLDEVDPTTSEPAVFIDVYQDYAPTTSQTDPPATTSDLGFYPSTNPPTPPTPDRIGRFIMVGSQLTVANSLPTTTGISTFASSGNTNGTVFQYFSTLTSSDNPVWRFQSMQALGSQNSTDPTSMEYWANTNVFFQIDYMQPSKSGLNVNYSPTQRVSNVVYQYPTIAGTRSGSEAFYNQWASGLLGTLTSTNDLDDLYVALSSETTGLDDALGAVSTTSGSSPTYNELARPNAIYNWEVGFHAPMELVNSLLNTQQFDLALQVLAYIFDPLAEGTASNRFWKWLPFQSVNAQDSLLDMFNNLKPNQPDNTYGINDWRNDPFEPFLVGRDRPVAFMKWVAVTYIQIMIAYGDYYFRQNTLETIPLALECYVAASNAYGPRAQQIPKRGKKKVQTYNSLVDNWDAFSNAQVQLELAFPFSNQIQFPVGYSNGVTGLANIWGFATELYFCVPDNSQLASIRDTIDDRLYKIRHCENIQGIVETLPLYEPPINPALLVAATAQGLSLASVVNDLDAPLPNYRFNYMLQKALDICNEVKSLGVAFLTVKEKEDVDALEALRAANELAINNLIMTSKTLALSEAQSALDGLNQNRLAPAYRMQANLQLIGGDLSTIPGPSDDFTPANDNIEIPQDSSGLKLIQSEIDEVNLANQAIMYNSSSSSQEVLAGILHQFPDIGVSVERRYQNSWTSVTNANFADLAWGVGVSSSFGE